MIDKITFSSTISNGDRAYLVELHRLQGWINEDNTQIEYKSSYYSNITGIEVYIKNNKLKLTTSLHKFWENRNFGKMCNSNEFTISEAKLAAEMLLFENRLNPNKTYVTYFEIGLNIQVSYDPLSFIELAGFISTTHQKEMFIDANYRKNRQRTTEKYKDIRKYFKIYDKGWQVQEKDRVPINCRDKNIKILRIETCHKRVKELSNKFFSDSNMRRLTNRFSDDWDGLFFMKKVTGRKGCRESEVQRANKLINYGPEFLINYIKKDMKPGLYTKNHLRTVREFIRDFDKLKYKFNIEVSEQEKEYKILFFNALKSARE